jgi:hypothetical protein
MRRHQVQAVTKLLVLYANIVPTKHLKKNMCCFLENIKSEDQKAMPVLELLPSQCQAKAVAGAASENHSTEPENSPATIEFVKAVAASENHSIEPELSRRQRRRSCLAARRGGRGGGGGSGGAGWEEAED